MIWKAPLTPVFTSSNQEGLIVYAHACVMYCSLEFLKLRLWIELFLDHQLIYWNRMEWLLFRSTQTFGQDISRGKIQSNRWFLVKTSLLTDSVRVDDIYWIYSFCAYKPTVGSMSKTKSLFLMICAESILSENFSKKFDGSLSFLYQCFLGYSA